jgi:hypothetical protein
VALTLCYAGIAAAFVHDLQFSRRYGRGVDRRRLRVRSSVSYALYLSGSAGMIARLGAARFTALAMLVSTAATGGHFLATQPLAALVQPWPVYALGAAMGLSSAPCCRCSPSRRRFVASAAGRRRWLAWSGRS